MAHSQGVGGPALIKALGIGGLLAQLPQFFLDIYRMRLDGSFYDQQDYLAKLRTNETRNELALRLMVEQHTERRHRALENSPFDRDADDVRQLAVAETENGLKPALLIAPFARDKNTSDTAAYRLAISARWRRAAWRNYLTSLDGLIVRPLHHTDVDLYEIRRTLRGLPVVLIHGGIQADRRVWPEIVAWDLVERPSGASNNDDAGQSVPPIQIGLPMFEVRPGSESDPVAAELEVQDQVAAMCTLIAGILGDWFRTLRFGHTPSLYRLLAADDDRKTAGREAIRALDVAVELHKLDPLIAHVRQAEICVDVGLYLDSIKYIDKSAIALKAYAGDDSAPLAELRRNIVTVYDLAIADMSSWPANGQMTHVLGGLEKNIHELKEWLRHRTLGGFGYDDPPSGGRS